MILEIMPHLSCNMFHPQMFSLMFSTRIHPEAWFFVRWGLFISLILTLSPINWLWLWGLLVTLGILLFFRNPYRHTLSLPKALVAPADGVVIAIQAQNPPEELELPSDNWIKISIFLSPLDVHINRIPCDGVVVKKIYRPGAFAHVATKEERPDNERLSLVIEQEDQQVVCTQIAGFMARRIICQVHEETVVKTGEEYGIICFGSRTDLYIPKNSTVLIKEGQTLRGGESLLGFLVPPSQISDVFSAKASKSEHDTE